MGLTLNEIRNALLSAGEPPGLAEHFEVKTIDNRVLLTFPGENRGYVFLHQTDQNKPPMDNLIRERDNMRANHERMRHSTSLPYEDYAGGIVGFMWQAQTAGVTIV